jgi:hypothetical protein
LHVIVTLSIVMIGYWIPRDVTEEFIDDHEHHRKLLLHLTGSSRCTLYWEMIFLELLGLVEFYFIEHDIMMTTTINRHVLCDIELKVQENHG